MLANQRVKQLLFHFQAVLSSAGWSQFIV